jgi:hypothetical protein
MAAVAGAVASPGVALALELHAGWLMQQLRRRSMMATNVAENLCDVWPGSWQLSGQRVEARMAAIFDTAIAPALNHVMLH